MNEEITEGSKAIQEVAKTTKKAIEATEKLGSFIAKIISEPINEIIGTLTDKIKYTRWERQISLLQKSEKLISENNIVSFRLVPPKFLIPLIENASLEEDDTLQDLWANLLVKAINPNAKFPKYSFLDIIKQLEPIDVKVLDYSYKLFLKTSKDSPYLGTDEGYDNYTNIDPTIYKIIANEITTELNINRYDYFTSIDNLMRMRLLTYYVDSDMITVTLDNDVEAYDRTLIKGYSEVSITAFGLAFIEACVKIK